jgi:hypothetical protein
MLQLLKWRRLPVLLLLLLVMMMVGRHWHTAANCRRHVARASWCSNIHRHHTWTTVALCWLLWLLHVPSRRSIPHLLLLLLVAHAMCYMCRQHPSSSRHVAMRHLVAACINTLLLLLVLRLLVHAGAASSTAWYAG